MKATRCCVCGQRLDQHPKRTDGTSSVVLTPAGFADVLCDAEDTALKINGDPSAPPPRGILSATSILGKVDR